MPVQERVADITERIVRRSRSDRQRYLDHIREAARRGPQRGKLSCGNLAHGFAACGAADKQDAHRRRQSQHRASSPPITTCCRAHQPFERFPAVIKQAAREAGAVAQFAGGVPAMCDGVTQGQRGHGAVAVLPRRDRAGDGGGAVATTCSTPRSISASATRSCPAW